MGKEDYGNSWAEFIRAHLAVLAGTDFFTAEVLTLRGLVTYYVLFFIHLESRKVDIAGITVQRCSAWCRTGACRCRTSRCRSGSFFRWRQRTIAVCSPGYAMSLWMISPR